MRDLVATLLAFDDVDRHVGAMMTGLSVRYDLGSDLDDVGRSSGDRPVRIGGGGESSLFDLMQDGRGLPLDASTDRTASSLAAEVAPGVRPDACVAWTSHEEDAEAGLAEALRRWFGGVGVGRPDRVVGPPRRTRRGHDQPRHASGNRPMKAVRFHRYRGPDVLTVEDIDRPEPGPGQVRIAVRAAGVNPIDWKLRAGIMHALMPLSFPRPGSASTRRAWSMPSARV